MQRSVHVYKSIGIIRTPYPDNAPYQPLANAEGECKLILDDKYTGGLHLLETFKYIYVLFALDKVKIFTNKNRIHPPWAPGAEVGVFASRTPNRPNPIGVSVVRVIKVSGNTVYISSIDAFDGSPLLDIKPYLKDLDAKPDANYGWAGQTGDPDHLALHIKGIPHEH